MNQTFGTICWLRVTDYMRGWMHYALGTCRGVKGEVILSVFHLDGAHEVFMMGSDDVLPVEGSEPGNAMSDTWYNALDAGLELDALAVGKAFGVTRELLDEFVPIVCPRYAVTMEGVIHHWTCDTCFGKQQAVEMIRLLRGAFWDAVSEFSTRYKAERGGERYAQVEMIEAFCRETDTDDVYIEAIRREWQRRLRRMKSEE